MERKMANAAVPEKTEKLPVAENLRLGGNPSLADYVIARLADLGIEHAFGVPGDGAPSSAVTGSLGSNAATS
jgi:hypothetical protein